MSLVKRLRHKLEEYKLYRELAKQYKTPIDTGRCISLLQNAQSPREVRSIWRLYDTNRGLTTSNKRNFKITAPAGGALVAEHGAALDERLIRQLAHYMRECENWHPVQNLAQNQALSNITAQQLLEEIDQWFQKHPYSHGNQNIYRALKTLGERGMVPEDHSVKTFLAQRMEEDTNTPLRGAALQLDVLSVKEVRERLGQLGPKRPNESIYNRRACDYLEWLCYNEDEDKIADCWMELVKRSPPKARTVLRVLPHQQKRQLLSSEHLTQLLAQQDRKTRQQILRLLPEKESADPRQNTPAR